MSSDPLAWLDEVADQRDSGCIGRSCLTGPPPRDGLIGMAGGSSISARTIISASRVILVSLPREWRQPVGMVGDQGPLLW
jgi:hypothetical protein